MLQPDPLPARTDELPVSGCVLWPVRSYADSRGGLVVTEFDRDLPFVPRRCFFVHSVPSQQVRGEHAHIECTQLLVAVHGSLDVVVDDASERAEVRLDRPDLGLLVPPGVWARQQGFSTDAVLCVFSSHPYREADFIRDYDTFLKFRKGVQRP